MAGNVGGAHAEYNCVPADSAMVIKPAGISFEDAATAAFGPNTALDFLRRANVGPGTRILIVGASGSVGAAAVQLAHYLGAEVTSPERCQRRPGEVARRRGHRRRTKQDVRRLGDTFDVVFDTVGSVTSRT